jgi:hypothetical protein
LRIFKFFRRNLSHFGILSQVSDREAEGTSVLSRVSLNREEDMDCVTRRSMMQASGSMLLGLNMMKLGLGDEAAQFQDMHLKQWITRLTRRGNQLAKCRTCQDRQGPEGLQHTAAWAFQHSNIPTWSAQSCVCRASLTSGCTIGWTSASGRDATTWLGLSERNMQNDENAVKHWILPHFVEKLRIGIYRQKQG